MSDQSASPCTAMQLRAGDSPCRCLGPVFAYKRVSYLGPVFRVCRFTHTSTGFRPRPQTHLLPILRGNRGCVPISCVLGAHQKLIVLRAHQKLIRSSSYYGLIRSCHLPLSRHLLFRPPPRRDRRLRKRRQQQSARQCDSQMTPC